MRASTSIRSTGRLAADGGRSWPDEPTPISAPNAEVVTVDLPRPRDRIRLASQPDYVRARESVLRFLYERHRFVEAAE